METMLSFGAPVRIPPFRVPVHELHKILVLLNTVMANFIVFVVTITAVVLLAHAWKAGRKKRNIPPSPGPLIVGTKSLLGN